MQFKLKYALDGMRVDLAPDEVLNFHYGGDHSVLVRVLHAIDENNPVGKTLVCEAWSEKKVDDAIKDSFEGLTAGTPLDIPAKTLFAESLYELYDYMLKTVLILRWRRSMMDVPIKPFINGKQGYSLDGVVWQEIPVRAVSATISFGHPESGGKISETVCEEIVSLVEQGASEPLERQLFREAWNLRAGFPKAALVIGVAGAEIGFRHLVGKIGRRRGIFALLKIYWPHPAIPVVQGIQITPSQALLDNLKASIHKRDAVVHNGAAAPDPDELREILWNIGQLLWIWDFYSGHVWALEHLSANSVSK